MTLDMSNNTALTDLRVQSNKFSVAALNELFGTLHDNNTVNDTKIMYIYGNPGTATCDKTIAEGKDWTVNTTTAL